ncbi:MAG: N-acetyltransferase, partial [Chloroflexia bacterium]|nr:N-acetyltransferase [Chloroflexia bacterium]
GLAALRGRGVPAAVVLGEPAYYGRFGFSAGAAARIRSPFSGPALQALELALGGLGSGVGEARYHAAFFVG